MGLTNYLKKKLQGTPKTAKKVYETTKKGATTTFNATQKAINSPKLDKIGKFAQGVSYGIETGAGTFNHGLGMDQVELSPGNNDFSDLEFTHQREHRPHNRDRHRHRHHREHQNEYNPLDF